MSGLLPFASFVTLCIAVFAAFGVASPFLPSLIESRGVSAEQVGFIFAAGTAIRLVSAPLACRVADRTRALRLTLAIYAVLAAVASLGYLSATGFALIVGVSLYHSLVRNLVVQIELAKPSIGQMQLDLLTQSAFRADAVAVAEMSIRIINSGSTEGRPMSL
jgi:MFS family permease